MAKKGETLSLNSIKKFVQLYQSYHETKKVSVDFAAKELCVTKWELWEFICNNKSHFKLDSYSNPNSDCITKRYIIDVLD